MTVNIALLRAINVGGHAPVAMSDLRELLADLGFDQIRSLLQTGNLVFRSKRRAGSDLEQLLEAEARKSLNLPTDFLVRTADEWAAVVADNPFHNEAKRDPSHLVVMFLKDAPDAKALQALRASVKGPEIVRTVRDHRHIYIVYPAGIARSRLTNKLIEAKFATRGTARNWNTVLKLADLAKT
ncbi:MAG: DUF1697 domain-containing protein [Candidatus Binataceae bacterium]